MSCLLLPPQLFVTVAAKKGLDDLCCLVAKEGLVSWRAFEHGLPEPALECLSCEHDLGSNPMMSELSSACRLAAHDAPHRFPTSLISSWKRWATAAFPPARTWWWSGTRLRGGCCWRRAPFPQSACCGTCHLRCTWPVRQVGAQLGGG